MLRIENKDVDNLLNKYTSMASNVSGIKAQEEFLADCKNVFHPNHYIPLAIKFSLCQVTCPLTNFNHSAETNHIFS